MGLNMKIVTKVMSIDWHKYICIIFWGYKSWVIVVCYPSVPMSVGEMSL